MPAPSVPDDPTREALLSGDRRRRSRAGLPWGALLVVLALVVAACGGGDEDAADEPSASTEAPPATAPLTGEEVADPSVLDRPALVVKIDNVDQASRPQAGINAADVVVEEKVEGPISRFAAVYHSSDVGDLGPVRSGRSTDVAIVSSLGRPLYAFSGANGVFLQQLREAPLIDVGFDVVPDSYRRLESRRAPDNLWTTGEGLRSHTPDDAGPPPPQFTYRATGAAAPAGARAVQGVDFSFGEGGAAMAYRWDAARAGWARTQAGTPHVDTDGEQVVPANVILQFVHYDDTGMTDTSGAPVPEARLVAEGSAWVLVDGHLVEARWSKPDAATPTRFTTATGEPVDLTPGRTWVSLVPVDGDATVAEAQP